MAESTAPGRFAARTRPAPRTLPAASSMTAAGAGHLAAGPRHLSETSALTAFFFTASAVQVLFGARQRRAPG